LPSYAFNRSGSPPDDHRTRLGGACNIPIILLTSCECAPERLPCLVEYLKATQLFPRPYSRFTSYLYPVYETIPPLVPSWYTIWAKVIVIVATYRRVVTPTNRLVPPISPPPLASSSSHDLAPTAVEQVQLRASAEHLLILASGVGQPAEPSVTQVGTPGRTSSPSNPRSGDPLANMIVPDAGRESGPASPASESSSGYLTASKLRLSLPSFSSILPAETDVWSPLRSVSALA